MPTTDRLRRRGDLKPPGPPVANPPPAPIRQARTAPPVDQPRVLGRVPLRVPNPLPPAEPRPLGHFNTQRPASGQPGTPGTIRGMKDPLAGRVPISGSDWEDYLRGIAMPNLPGTGDLMAPGRQTGDVRPWWQAPDVAERTGQLPQDPAILDVMNDPTLSDRDRTNRLQALDEALRVRSDLIESRPDLADEVQNIPLEAFAGLTEADQDMVSTWGPSYLNLTPYERNVFRDIAVDDSYTPEERRNLMSGMLSIGDERRADELARQRGSDVIEDFMSGLREIQQQAAVDPELLAELQRRAETPPISEQLFNQMVAEADRLILRTYGQRAHDAADVIGRSGFSGSSFERNVQEHYRSRALEAQLGSRTELRQLQAQVNAANSLEYNRLIATVQDRGVARQLQLQGMIGNASQLLASLEGTSTFQGIDFSGILSVLSSLRLDDLSVDQLERELNPWDPRNWGDIVAQSLQTVLPSFLLRGAT